LTIPFEPTVFGIKVNIHLVFEYLAFFIAFRYYIKLRSHSYDQILNRNRLSIILGAIIGAFLGSRLIGFLENPMVSFNTNNLVQLLNTKSIMGGLFGGLIGVESSKNIIGEKHSSGDLFTFPIIVGIFIGRIGCFLSGTNEFTYGSETNFITGMNLGDGLLRHPTSLYEIAYLLLLFIFLKSVTTKTNKENGLLFKLFMIHTLAFVSSLSLSSPMFFIFWV
jgi:phosphatidylglycerol---prolipoprotein diacylglyceryl transferase